MKIWITSDTHFQHQKMIEYCHRPQDFDQLIWNGLKIIQENDVLIHLGDICFGKSDIETHFHLQGGVKGTKILVRGNHDRKTALWYMDHGWDFVCDKLSGVWFGKRILFTHEPQPKEKNIDMNIHGHFHNAAINYAMNEFRNFEYDPKWHRLLALEYTNYKPVDLEKIINEPRTTIIGTKATVPREKLSGTQEEIPPRSVAS